MRGWIAACLLSLPALASAQSVREVPRPLPDPMPAHQHGDAMQLTGTLPGGVPDPCPASLPRLEIPANEIVTASGKVAPLGCVDVKGTWRFLSDTRISVDTIIIHPGGWLDLGEAQRPLRAVEILIASGPIDTTTDPAQWGRGILGVGGKITVHGVDKTSGYVRFAQAPRAGDTTLQLASKVTGWLASDELIIPDTRTMFVGHAGYAQKERLRIASVSADGLTVTLQTPLQHDHLGMTKPDGTLAALPHVGNLTRSIVIRSADPAGTRFHTLFTNDTQVDIRYASFRDGGRTTDDPLDCTLRESGFAQTASHCTEGTGAVTHIGTNQIGRYEVHLHHLRTAAKIHGNSMIDGRKWPIAVHNTHFSEVTENVIVDGRGAGIMSEDGNETDNLIARNFIVGQKGQGDRSGFGREGIGIYLRGPLTRVVDNIAANMETSNVDVSYGFKIFNVYNERLRRPKFLGADTTNDAEVDIIDGNQVSLAEFRDNETYATESCLSPWWVGYGVYYPGGQLAPVDGRTPTAPRSTINGFTCWAVWNKGVFAYESTQLTFTRLKFFNRFEVGTVGFLSGDYIQEGGIVSNSEIRGFEIGIYPSTINQRHEQRIEHTVLQNTFNLMAETLGTSGSHAGTLHPRTVVVDRLRVDPAPGRPLSVIRSLYAETPTRHLVQRDRIRFTNWQGVDSDDFEWFSPQQAPSFVVPPTDPNCYSVIGAEDRAKRTANPLACAPLTGLTNAQLWASQQLAIRGAVAPCTTTRPGFEGFTCTDGPPPTPVDCVVSDWGPWSEWSAWVSDGKGTDTRTRTRTRMIVTQPAHGGAACPSLSETETETRPTPVDPCTVSPIDLAIFAWPILTASGPTVAGFTPTGTPPFVVSFTATTATITDARGCSRTVSR